MDSEFNQRINIMTKVLVRKSGPIRHAVLATILLLGLSAISFAQAQPSRASTDKLRTGTEPALASVGGAASTAQPQDATIADKYTTVFGAKMHYLEAGSGPVVILLHGLGGSTANWAPTIAPLAQKYRVIVPDQIGIGKSEKPLIHYRVA